MSVFCHVQVLASRHKTRGQNLWHFGFELGVPHPCINYTQTSLHCMVDVVLMTQNPLDGLIMFDKASASNCKQAERKLNKACDVIQDTWKVSSCFKTA